MDSLLHAMFVVLSAAGFIYRRIHRAKQRKRQRIAQAHAEMVQFHERQRQIELAAMGGIASTRGKPVVTPPAGNAEQTAT